MKITFSSGKLQKLCEQQAIAQKKLGKDCARKLRSCLADLDAATSVQDLVAGRPHPLKGERLGQFSQVLQGGKRLVFEPANAPIPYKEDGSIHWSQVTNVRIVFIGDYHD